MITRTATPLRYPGGKTILADYFKSYIHTNELQQPIYAEPYCGGAGAAITLLLDNVVSKIILNDANFSIYAFWKSLVDFSDDFLELFETTPVTIEEWHKQRFIFKDCNKIKDTKDLILSKGFATFYLNRCNRSGILTSGPIGGQSEKSQNQATSKIDARFNKTALRRKLEAIIEKKEQVTVTNLDALAFLKNKIGPISSESSRNVFVYLDPPYYKQGSSLYLNYYKNSDHQLLAEYLQKDHDFRWLLSYDKVSEISALYQQFNQYSFYLNYSAQHSKLGCELLIPSSNSILPNSSVIKVINKKKIELVPI